MKRGCLPPCLRAKPPLCLPVMRVTSGAFVERPCRFISCLLLNAITSCPLSDTVTCPVGWQVAAIDEEMDAGVFERLKVWTWGKNDKGQLGSGSYAGIMIPELNQANPKNPIPRCQP